jgi:hypothetical protein
VKLERPYIEKRSYLGGPELEVSNAQFWFERLVRWAAFFAAGFGLATVLYNVPDLKAHDEYLQKLLRGAYPGIEVTTTDCKPITVK